MLLGGMAAVLLIVFVSGKRIIYHTGLAPILLADEIAAATQDISEEQTPVFQPFDPQLWDLNAAGPQVMRGIDFVVNGWMGGEENIEKLSARFAQTDLVIKEASHEVLAIGDRPLIRYRLHLALPDSFASLDRQVIEVVASTSSGEERIVGTRAWLPDSPVIASSVRPFRFLMMTSGIASGGGAGLDTQYQDYQFPHLKTGMSVPILYLRTTKGAEHDYIFDPDFDLSRQCGERSVADDNLKSIITFAVEKKVPIQFILNGGVWSDASCDFSEWDLTDRLEENIENCQWAQDDMVYPDNYLKDLPGSVSSSRLARSLTYHVHAQQVRYYKKRNLQQAGRVIAEFARQYPDLFVGVTLDSDTYMNPFFEKLAFFDYNPGMLRQFREWLQGAGPYLGAQGDAPDLSQYRRDKTYSLAEINTLAGQQWQHWDELEPIRPDPDTMSANYHQDSLWRNPWWQLWDTFRKHIVHLHYSELAQWLAEAGIPEERIFTAQGFAGMKVSVRIDDQPFYNDFDSAGVSIEGGKPKNNAHLGAIIYGHVARNDGFLKNKRPLFSEFARRDQGWAIVEYNPVGIHEAQKAPVYQGVYQTFRELFNFDAQQAALMAWNGSNGLFAGAPEYVGYTSFRNTATEEAMRDFIIAHSFFPESIRLWTFGSTQHVSDDGWHTTIGALTPMPGMIQLQPQQDNITLESPKHQVIRIRQSDYLSLVVPEAQQHIFSRIVIAAKREHDADWTPIAEVVPPASVSFVPGFARLDIPLIWPESWRQQNDIATQLQVSIVTASTSTAIKLHRISIAQNAS